MNRRREVRVERPVFALVGDVRRRLERAGRVEVGVEHLIARCALDRLPAHEPLGRGHRLRHVRVEPAHVEAERRAPRRHDLPVRRLPPDVGPQRVGLARHPGKLMGDGERRDLQLGVREERRRVVEALAGRQLEVVGPAGLRRRIPGEGRRAGIERLRCLVRSEEKGVQPGRCPVQARAGRGRRGSGSGRANSDRERTRRSDELHACFFGRPPLGLKRSFEG